MKKKKIIKVVSIIVGVLVVLTIGLSAALGAMIADQVLHQNKNNDTIANSVKQLATWGYDLDGFNNTYSSIAKDVSATSEDGYSVPATYFDNGGDVCVVLVHGAGGDRACTYPLAQQYLERGYDVIALDQRGCGLSSDDRVTFGIIESLDIRALVKYAKESLGKEKVIVHGQSMGGQTTAIYASNVTPGAADAADAVICDSPVPGMEFMLRSVFGDDDPEAMYGSVSDYFMFTCGAYLKLVNGIDYKDGDTIAQVAKDKLPTLVVVSENDTVCPKETVEEVYNNVGSDIKSSFTVNSKHIEGIIDDPTGYMANVEAFLNPLGL